jgi:hypothetical protein
LHVAEIDLMAEAEDDDLLRLFGHAELHTVEARRWLSEQVGAKEMAMEMHELEGYDEVIQKLLASLPPEQRLAGLPPEQRLAGLPPEQRLAGLPPEQRLAGLPPEQRGACPARRDPSRPLGRLPIRAPRRHARRRSRAHRPVGPLPARFGPAGRRAASKPSSGCVEPAGPYARTDRTTAAMHPLRCIPC